MIQPYFVALLLLLGSAAANQSAVSLPIIGNYPYSIKLDYDSGSPAERNETITIYQNGKRRYSINDYDIEMIYHGNLDSDGYDEAILQTFSGGAHCCFRLVFLDFDPKMPIPKIYEWGNTEYITIKDLDNDKRPEIITWDDRYSYAFGLSFAESVSVKVVAHYQNGTLKLDNNLTEQYAPVAIKNTPIPVKVSIDEQGFLEYNGAVRDIMRFALHRFYIGKKEEAVRWMHRYLHFEHPAVKKLFVDDLVDMMTQSPFWDDLRRINGWHMYGICSEINGKTVCPEKLYDKVDIIVWLFERL